MGQKLLYLDYHGATALNGRYSVAASLPLAASVANGPYIVFVLVKGAPTVGVSVLVEALRPSFGLLE